MTQTLQVVSDFVLNLYTLKAFGPFNVHMHTVINAQKRRCKQMYNADDSISR